MEHCNLTVSDLVCVTGKQLSENQLQIIMRELLKCLEYFHRRKLAHKDIKANNIFLNHDGHCKLEYWFLLETWSHRETTKIYNHQYRYKEFVNHWMSPELLLSG
eukprot:216668_1